MDIVVPACHAGLGRKEEGQEKGGEEEGSEELISGKQSEPFIQKGQLESDSSGCPVGYLATTEDEYAAAMRAVFAMSSEERERMATAGRERAKRFSEENFDKSFKDVLRPGAASADDGVSQDKEVAEDKRKRKAQEGADREAAAKAGEAGEARSGKLARVAPVAEPEAPVAELEAPVAETRSGRPAPAADPAAPWSVGHPEGHPRSPFLRLHQEIAEFCRFVEASEQEKQARAEAVGRVTAVIHSIWAHCHVEVFGSYATGVYLPTSDVDRCGYVQRALRALAMFVPVLQTHSASALLPPITPSLPSLFQMVVLHSGYGSAALGLSGRAEGTESTGEGAGGEEGGSQHEGLWANAMFHSSFRRACYCLKFISHSSAPHLVHVATIDFLLSLLSLLSSIPSLHICPPLQVIGQAIIKFACRSSNIPFPHSSPLPVRLFPPLQVIGQARVPIIKFLEIESGVSFDISFDTSNGPETAKFIRKSMKAMPALRPISLVLKLFLQQRGLNEVFTGGIGSYALLVMIMAHLQTHHSCFSSGKLEQNLGVLLIDFFHLYGRGLNTIDVGVSARHGGRFFVKRDRGMVQQNRFMLAVEDPQMPSNDLSRGSHNIHNVRLAFQRAHYLLTTPTLPTSHRSPSQINAGSAPAAGAATATAGSVRLAFQRAHYLLTTPTLPSSHRSQSQINAGAAPAAGAAPSTGNAGGSLLARLIRLESAIANRPPPPRMVPPPLVPKHDMSSDGAAVATAGTVVEAPGAAAPAVKAKKGRKKKGVASATAAGGKEGTAAAAEAAAGTEGLAAGAAEAAGAAAAVANTCGAYQEGPTEGVGLGEKKKKKGRRGEKKKKKWRRGEKGEEGKDGGLKQVELVGEADDSGEIKRKRAKRERREKETGEKERRENVEVSGGVERMDGGEDVGVESLGGEKKERKGRKRKVLVEEIQAEEMEEREEEGEKDQEEERKEERKEKQGRDEGEGEREEREEEGGTKQEGEEREEGARKRKGKKVREGKRKRDEKKRLREEAQKQAVANSAAETRTEGVAERLGMVVRERDGSLEVREGESVRVGEEEEESLPRGGGRASSVGCGDDEDEGGRRKRKREKRGRAFMEMLGVSDSGSK
ncbi:unnamed protein product [Closterium sp. Naga37s-1]|nr:unnamed protein product [Closterium sp. Naga37s-1]